MSETKRKSGHWSPDEMSHLMSAAKKGVQMDQIAEKLGRSTSATEAKYQSLINRERQLLHEQLCKKMPNRGKEWTQDDDEMLKTLYDTNATIPEIIRHCGRTGAAVMTRMARLGLVHHVGEYYYPVVEPLMHYSELIDQEVAAYEGAPDCNDEQLTDPLLQRERPS